MNGMRNQTGVAMGLALLATLFAATTAVAGRNVDAFDDAGFEKVSAFHGETNGVEIAGGIGYNTSGGLRLDPARGKNGKITKDMAMEAKGKAVAVADSIKSSASAAVDSVTTTVKSRIGDIRDASKEKFMKAKEAAIDGVDTVKKKISE